MLARGATGLWVLLSLGIHVAVAVLIVGGVVCTPPQIGSDAIAVELVQPRLAAPPQSTELGRHSGHRRVGAPASVTPPRDRGTPDQARFTTKAKVEGKARAIPQAPAAGAPAQAKRKRRPRMVASERRSSPLPVAEDGNRSRPTFGKGKRRLTMEARRLLAAMSSMEPAVAAPRRLAREVSKSLRAKRSRHARRLARARASRRHVATMLARMSETARASARGTALRGSGTGRGASPELGLRFYLSGRRVLNSRVVRPPRPKVIPPTRCRVGRLGIPPATVRMLVGRKGEVPVAYLKHASGHRGFDRCALAHAKGMRFYPGVDARGRALDVWIHLRLEPQVRVSAVVR